MYRGPKNNVKTLTFTFKGFKSLEVAIHIVTLPFMNPKQNPEIALFTLTIHPILFFCLAVKIQFMTTCESRKNGKEKGI